MTCVPRNGCALYQLDCRIVADGTPDALSFAGAAAFHRSTKEENRQASLESRFSAHVTDNLSYVAGTYLFTDNLPVTVVDATNLSELGKKPLVPGNPNSPLNLDSQLIQYNQKTSTAAVFGNVDYTIVPDLTLSNCPNVFYDPSGNFNGSPSTLGAAIVAANPETVDSYELGLKSQWFDRRPRTFGLAVGAKF